MPDESFPGFRSGCRFPVYAMLKLTQYMYCVCVCLCVCVCVCAIRHGLEKHVLDS